MVGTSQVAGMDRELPASQTGAQVDVKQYLTFSLGGEEYGVDILCDVQEIRGWDSVTPIPSAPPHIRGVINRRGTIVPIADLGHCFGLDMVKYSPQTVVMVAACRNCATQPHHGHCR